MDTMTWATIALWIIASFFLVLTLVLLFVGIPVALDVKRTIRRVQGTIDEVRVKADPILFKAQEVASDIQQMTATAKREAERVGASIGPRLIGWRLRRSAEATVPRGGPAPSPPAAAC